MATPTEKQTEYTQYTETPKTRRPLIDLMDVLSETESKHALTERIVQAELARDVFEMDQRLARVFVASGLFKDVGKDSAGNTISEQAAIAQAYVKIAMGRSMGFCEAESMQGIDIIKGRPSVGAQLRAARMQRAGYSWTFQQQDNTGCKITVFYKDQELGPASYTSDDAKSAGNQGKDNYVKNPSDMYFARAITRAQRRYAPGVLSLDVLSTEEARDLSQATDVKQDQPLLDKVKAGRDQIVGSVPADGGNAKAI